MSNAGQIFHKIANKLELMDNAWVPTHVEIPTIRFDWWRQIKKVYRAFSQAESGYTANPPKSTAASSENQHA